MKRASRTAVRGVRAPEHRRTLRFCGEFLGSVVHQPQCRERCYCFTKVPKSQRRLDVTSVNWGVRRLSIFCKKRNRRDHRGGLLRPKTTSLTVSKSRHSTRLTRCHPYWLFCGSYSAIPTSPTSSGKPTSPKARTIRSLAKTCCPSAVCPKLAIL